VRCNTRIILLPYSANVLGRLCEQGQSLNSLPLSGVVDHPTMGVVRYQITETSNDPDQQVDQTIGLMRRYAVEDSAAPSLIEDARQAWVSDNAISDTWDYLNRANGYRSMQFIRDESTANVFGSWRPFVEALIRPVDQVALSQAQGDCDDFAMYGAALLLARGVPCSYVTVAADDSDPSVYSHVYLVAYPTDGPYTGQRVPLDLSHGAYCGWEVENRFGKRAEWPLLETGALSSLWWMFAAVGIAAFLLYREVMR
jgi:hypothetical protein